MPSYQYILQIVASENRYHCSIFISYSDSLVYFLVPIIENASDFMSETNTTDEIIQKISEWLLTEEAHQSYLKVSRCLDNMELIYSKTIDRYVPTDDFKTNPYQNLN